MRKRGSQEAALIKPSTEMWIHPAPQVGLPDLQGHEPSRMAKPTIPPCRSAAPDRSFSEDWTLRRDPPQSLAAGYPAKLSNDRVLRSLRRRMDERANSTLIIHNFSLFLPPLRRPTNFAEAKRYLKALFKSLEASGLSSR